VGRNSWRSPRPSKSPRRRRIRAKSPSLRCRPLWDQDLLNSRRLKTLGRSHPALRVVFARKRPPAGLCFRVMRCTHAAFSSCGPSM
jgi:hypothetical protein